MQKTSTAGFTLLELLVIVVIVGSLAAIAAPGWVSFLTNQRTKAVRGEMLQILQTAQSDAQRMNKSYVVGINSTTGLAALTVGPSLSSGIEYTLGSGQSRSIIKLETSAASVSFTHDGTLDTSASVPFAISVVSEDGTASPQCVVVTTILGGLITAEGDNCTNPNYVPSP